MSMSALRWAVSTQLAKQQLAMACPLVHSNRLTLMSMECLACIQGFHVQNILATKFFSTKSAMDNLSEDKTRNGNQLKSGLESNEQHHTASTITSNCQQELETLDKENVIQNTELTPSSEKLTVFHKPSRNVININVNTEEKHTEVSVFFRERNKLVNLRVDGEKFRRQHVLAQASLERDESHPRIESIEEVIWKEVSIDYSKLPQHYLRLAKIRLTGLVVITTMAGYAMAPGAFDPLTFIFCTIGTGLTSSAANTVNQYLEVPFDSQMNRTKNRPIVRGMISPLHAMTFAATTATTGLTMLALGVNPLTASLGLTNLLLYTMAYTPMKRFTIANTWVGSIVGAIPPMMGWAACSGALEPGAWLLGGILFAWQFPHFNALSWNLRPDYSRAGYRMMSVTNPDLCKRTTLRYSFGLIGLCTMAPILDVTTWAFAVDSFPLNAYMTYLAWRFYKQGDSNSSRKLFRFSLIHIPALLVLMLISKKTYGEKKDSSEITTSNRVFKVSSLYSNMKT